MTDHRSQGWEPDPQKMGNWASMFEQPRGAQQPPPAPDTAGDLPLDDRELLDSQEYRPWMLQRGRTRPAMMLELRRFEPRSGLWQGWVLSYPSLHAVEYIGERMLSLDFGLRQFVIEGDGLAPLVGLIQHGVVLSIHEYSPALWPSKAPGPAVTSIRRVVPETPPQR